MCIKHHRFHMRLIGHSCIALVYLEATSIVFIKAAVQFSTNLLYTIIDTIVCRHQKEVMILT